MNVLTGRVLAFTRIYAPFRRPEAIPSGLRDILVTLHQFFKLLSVLRSYRVRFCNDLVNGVAGLTSQTHKFLFRVLLSWSLSQYPKSFPFAKRDQVMKSDDSAKINQYHCFFFNIMRFKISSYLQYNLNCSP